MKKLFIVSMCVLFVLSACSSATGGEGKKYDKAIADFYTTSNLLYKGTQIILSDYSSTWSSAIDNGKDFNDALSKEVNNFNGMLTGTNKVKETLSKDLKTISEGKAADEKKYGEIYNECKKTYTYLSGLIDQANSPSGSLISFNKNIDDLSQKFKSEHDILEALLSDNVKKIIKNNKKKEQNKNGKK